MGVLWISHLSAAAHQDGEVLLLLCREPTTGRSLVLPPPVFTSEAIFRMRMMRVDCFTLEAKRGSFAKINSVFQSLPGSLKHKGWLRAVTHGQEAASRGLLICSPIWGVGTNGGVGRVPAGGRAEERLNIMTASTSWGEGWKTVILSCVLPYWQMELF